MGLATNAENTMDARNKEVLKEVATTRELILKISKRYR